MSKSLVIRYQMRPDTADENQGLIEQVFAELAEVQPADLRYAAFRMDDGVTFVHVVTMPDEGSPLESVAAFKEFQREFGDRAATRPDVAVAHLVGTYGC